MKEAVKKAMGYLDQYVQGWTWRDVAVLKVCVLSLGALIGLSASKKEEDRENAAILAFCIFFVTYVPLMTKLAKKLVEIIREDQDAEAEEQEEEDWTREFADDDIFED